MQVRTRIDPVTGAVEEVAPEEIRDFCSILMELEKGQTHRDLSEAMYDLVAQVSDVKKKGTLSLLLTVEPLDKSEGGPVVVRADVKACPPKPPATNTVLYVDPKGNLSRSNPFQPELEGLRVIPDETKNVRSI